MELMKKAVEAKDYYNFKEAAHSLKGASGYVGASHVMFSCYHIQDAYLSNNYDLMIAYYPRLVEACIEFKIYSKTMIAEHEKVPFEVTPEIASCAIAGGWTVEKHSNG